jgi:hypothetical protein
VSSPQVIRLPNPVEKVFASKFPDFLEQSGFSSFLKSKMLSGIFGDVVLKIRCDKNGAVYVPTHRVFLAGTYFKLK